MVEGRLRRPHARQLGRGRTVTRSSCRSAGLLPALRSRMKTSRVGVRLAGGISSQPFGGVKHLAHSRRSSGPVVISRIRSHAALFLSSVALAFTTRAKVYIEVIRPAEQSAEPRSSP